MTKEQIKDLFNKVAEEADLSARLTLDEDEIKDVMIDNNNRIYLQGELTPYKAEDVKLIKYRINDDPDSCAGNPVLISFRNGDSIRIDAMGFCAIIDFSVYEDQAALLKYASMMFEDGAPARFQTWHDVKKQLEVCFEKAEIFDFRLQQSEHDFADIFLDNDTLYICETTETPYKLSDIKHIKYEVYSEVEKEWGFSDCVRITLHNGDYIDFTDYGDYEAYTKIGTHYHYFEGIENVAHRYALEIKAREMGVNDNEFVIVDNALIEYNGETKDVFIPEGVEIIEKQVFQHNDIKSVVFPSTLKKICERSFGNCRRLECVTLNDGLEILERETFAYCSSIRRIIIPTSVKQIGSQAFFCTSLSKEDVVIPKDCEIGKYLFDGDE